MSDALLARHAPDDPICFGASGTRSAGELRAFIQAISDALPAQRPGDAIVITCRDRYTFIAALLAGLARGFRVMLPPNEKAATVRALVGAAPVVAQLRDDDASEGLDLRALAPRAPAIQVVPLVLLGDEIVLYTSGSTGMPEAHTKHLSQLVGEAATHVRDFDLFGRRVVAGVPAQHIYGLLFSVMVPLLSGGSVLRQTPLFPRELCAELVRHGAEVLVSVPPQLVALAEDVTLQLPPMHRCFCSAGPLPREANATLFARDFPITEILGSTETGGIAFRERPDGAYKLMRGVRAQIDADAVLHVDAPWLAPDEPRPYRTADRVEACPEGFRHLGRADAVTKIGGKRVDLGDVEACLKGVAGVRDARVLAVDSGGVRGLALWAVVEGEASLDSLREALRARFDPVTLPKRYRVVASMPRAPQGKLRRSDLLQLFDTWELTFESQPEGAVQALSAADQHVLDRHFQGDPSLQAAVQLHQIALLQVRQRFPDLGRLEALCDLEFGSPVRSGDKLTLALTRRTPLEVDFALRADQRAASSGTFRFAERQP
jgi:acyl-coenzyme A synthetase/AMP-(fatty) acid ligase